MRFGRALVFPHRIRYRLGPASIAVTGTVTSSCVETSIVAGGKTILLTVTGDTWVASGATFDAQRQNIINGLTSAQSEAAGWNAKVKALEVVGAVVRTSDFLVTITLTASATYDISSTETITVTVPSTALTLGAALVGSPTFAISASGGAAGTGSVFGSLIVRAA